MDGSLSSEEEEGQAWYQIADLVAVGLTCVGIAGVYCWHYATVEKWAQEAIDRRERAIASPVVASVGFG